MNKEIVDLLFKYTEESSKIATQLLEDKKSYLKPDKTLVTDADQRISDLAYKMLGSYIDKKYIITEESLDDFEKLRKLKTPPEIDQMIVIDPVDGTRNYAHKIPLYGISVGILKDWKPWIGMVHFPSYDELFYSDGEKSYFVRNAFINLRGNREVIQLTKPDLPLDVNSIVYANVNFLKNYDWNHDFCCLLAPSCAVSNLCWPLMGRGNACIFGAHPWDLVGSWPVARNAGFELRRMSDGKVMDKMDFNDWDEDWWVKEHHIMCIEKDFQTIKDNIIKKNR